MDHITIRKTKRFEIILDYNTWQPKGKVYALQFQRNVEWMQIRGWIWNFSFFVTFSWIQKRQF